MAEDLFTQDLTHDMNWGDIDGKKASGDAVQRYIKGPLINSRIGYLHSVEDTESNQNILYGFANKSKYDEWMASNQQDDSLYLSKTQLAKADPQPYYYFTLRSTEEAVNGSINYVSIDDTVKLNLIFVAQYYGADGAGGLTPTPQLVSGDIEMQIWDNSLHQWKDADLSQVNTFIESTTDNSVTTVDLTPAFGTTSGKYRIQIRVAGEYNDGERFTTTWLQYNITKTKVDFSFATPWQNPVQVLGTGTYRSVTLDYYITGAVDKKLTLKITGDGGSEERIIEKTLSSNENYPITSRSLGIKIEDNYDDDGQYKITKNGIHNIEAYVTAYYNNVKLAESEHLYSRIYVKSDPNDNNIYITLNNINKKLINWATNKLFEYSVCGNGDLSSLSLQLIDINDNNIYINQQLDVEKGSVNVCNLSLDIDTSNNEIGSLVRIAANNNELYRDVVVIDNSGGYSPYAGAQFIFNPKKYNNDTFEGLLSEDDKYIINESDITNNKNISVTFDGFEFANDGFTVDEDGNRCFRVLGGQEFTINGFKPFKNSVLDSTITNNCVIEFVYAIRNIRSIPDASKTSDEDRPLIRVNDKENDNDNVWNGLEIKPYVGLFRTESNNDTLAQDVWLAGDKMINLIISITTNQVVFYINGVVNRIFSIDNGTLAFNRLKEAAIIIGNKDSKTDIDIYNIRVYQDDVNINNSYNNLLRNYISSLPTVSEKDAVKRVNEIIAKTDGGKEYINYEKCSDLGYNSLVWRPLSEPYSKEYEDNLNGFNVVGLAHGHNPDTKIAGDLEIRIYKENPDGTRELDKFKSGTIKNLRVKGQGTSSMGYWKWNQRWEFDKLEVKDGTIVKDEGSEDEYLEIQIEGGSLVRLKKGVDWDEDDGDNLLLSKFYPLILEDNTLSEELREEYTTKYVKNSYQIADGDPFAKRLDAKINWASPMQSHKLGSVGLYNDIWKDVIKTSDIINYKDPNGRGPEFTGTVGGYKDCRVAIRQLPFMLFVQKNPNDISETAKEFYGLFTMGPSKGDKPTFGYNKKDFPDYVMMEGMDNGALLANCAIPWNDVDIRPEGEKPGKPEYYVYQGKSDSGGMEAIGSWEISMGEKEKNSIVDLKESTSNPVLHKFKELINFCYTCKINIVAFNGDFGLFDEYYKGAITNPLVTTLTSDEKEISVDNMYWMYSGNEQYHLYRFDDRIGISGGWVNAGIEPIAYGENGKTTQYEVYNIYEEGDELLKEKLGSGSLSFRQKNNEVIKYRIRRYKGDIDTTRTVSIGNDLSIPATIGGIGDYVEVADLLYTLQMLKLIAASDNWAKNTYIYNPGIYEECYQGDIEGKIIRTHGKDSGNIAKGTVINVGDDVKQYGMARFATEEEKSNPSIQKYKLVSKFRFFQDDLDTIFSLDNTGKKVKLYYVDENDLDTTGAPCWNASQNPLFKNAYYAWDDPDYTYNDKNKDDTSVHNMMAMMKSILISMDKKGINNIGENNILNCWDKYYGSVTKYIPAYAYNEIVKSLYESAHNAKQLGEYTHSVEPYTQCVGDQYISEKEWFRKRSILFASYAQHGEFSAADGSTSEGALVFRSYAPGGNKPNYKYTVTYNQYIWPSAGKGQSPIRVSPWKRYEPGEKAVLDLGSTDGNTNILIRGINHIDSISDFGGTIVAANVKFIMAGDKLTSFKATELGAADVYPSNDRDYHDYLLFNPPSLEFNGMKSLRSIEITGETKFNPIEGSINLSDHTISITENDKTVTKNIVGSRNVEKIDLSGTRITSLVLPVPNVVTEVKLPNTITTIDLTESKRLTNEKLFIDSYNNVTSVTIKNCPLFDEYTFINEHFIKQNISLNDLTLHNINWTGSKQIDIEFLQKILKYNDLSLTGIIEIAPSNTVDFKLKMDLLSRFGNIDDPNNSLHIIYDKVQGSPVPEDHNIICPSHIWVPGVYDMAVNYVGLGGVTANDFVDVNWNVKFDGDSNNISINPKTGTLTITRMPQNIDSLTVSCTISRYNNQGSLIKITVSKVISLKQPVAKIGDYVYSDGTYSSPAEKFNNKDIIGICIYAEPVDSAEGQLKIAAATEIIKCSASSQEDLKTCAYLPSWGRNSATLFTNMMGTNSTQQEVNTRWVNKTFFDQDIITQKYANCTQIYPSLHDSSYWWKGSDSDGRKYDLPYIINMKHNSSYDNEESKNGSKSPLMDFGRGKYSDRIITNIDQSKASEWCAGKFNTMYLVNNRPQVTGNDGRPMISYTDLNTYKNTLWENLMGASSQFEYFNYVIMNSNTYKNYNDSGIYSNGALSNKARFMSNYNPAATYCHIYKPFRFANESNTNSLGNMLHEKFREGNWFLPSAAELSRILYFAYTNGTAFNGFSGLNVANGYDISFKDLNNILNAATGNTSGGRNLFWSSTSSSQNYNSNLILNNYAFCLGRGEDNTLRMYAEFYGSNTSSDNSYGNKENMYHLWPCVQF